MASSTGNNGGKEGTRKKFARKIVLITGASSGIGRQVAIDFANNGASKIILVSRTERKLIEVQRTIEQISMNGSGAVKDMDIIPYVCDVSHRQDVISMGRNLLKTLGKIDILVNNAGYGTYGRVSEQEIEEIESIMQTNYFGMVYCTRVFLNSMLSRHTGHIVNVASVAASFGVAGMAAYCASKYAMLGFSESLRHELHGSGVNVTVVSPIGVRTNFFNNTSFGDRKPNYTGFLLSPKTVSRAVISAASSTRLEIVVPFYIRAAIWVKYTLPYIVNPLVGTLFRNQLNKSSTEVS
ncbi:MAG: SDR family NAD(P)-dependent oxidoreductase [Nitrososphaeraceae archaeon]